MKIEKSQEFKYSIYTILDPELAGLIRNAGFNVSEVSPLSGVDRSNPDREPSEAAEGLKGALEILTDPGRIFSVRTWPAGGSWIHYYGASDKPNLVAFTRNERNGASLLIWPVTRTALVNFASAPLMSSAAEQQDETSFDLTLSELLLLASLADIHQEVSLQGFIDRRTSFDVLFTEDDIQATYRKGLITDDPRWVVSRLAPVIGDDLPDALDGVTGLLETFRRKRFLTKDEDGYLASPAGELVLRQLAEIDGLSSIVAKWRMNGKSRAYWEESRAIYQSNRWQIWHYDLSDSSQRISKSELRVISRAALSRGLDDVFKAPPFSSSVSDGQVLDEPKCSDSGKPFEHVASAPDTLKCPKCNAPLRKGVKFCTTCGQSLSAV